MPLTIRRIALVAGVPVQVLPPGSTNYAQVTLGNAGPADIQVYTDDPLQYVVIGAGYERLLTSPRATQRGDGWIGYGFVMGLVAFTVVSAQNGTLVLEWF